MKKEIYLITVFFIIELMILLPLSSAISISNVQIGQITDNNARVSWTTDQYATGIVNYGKTTALGKTQLHSNYLFDHSLYLYSLEDETQYYVEIESIDINGTSITDDNNGNYYTFTTKDITPPEKVTGLQTLDKGIDYIYLSWDTSSSPDTTNYLVYRDAQLIVNITNTNFNDTGLTSLTSYSYKVSAVDNINNEGPVSNLHTEITLQGDVISPIISDMQFSIVTDDSVLITWKTDEASTSVVNYGLDSNLDQIYQNSDLVTEHSITLSDLTKGSKYSYKAKSCDSSNNCVESDLKDFELGLDITPPSTNITLPKYYNKRTIDIIGAIEPNSRIKLYVNDMNLPIRSLDSSETSEGSFAFYNVVLSQNNNIRIWSQDQAGNVDQSDYEIIVDTEKPQVTLEDIPEIFSTKNLSLKGTVDEEVTMNIYLIKGTSITPSKINNLEAIADNNSVDLSWNKSTDQDFSHYVVYRDDVGAIATTEPETYNSFTDVLVNNGITYTYQVTAVNKYGEQSPRSDTATVTITGTSSGLPKPDEIIDIIGAKQQSYSENISGDFEKYLEIRDDGKYTLKIEFIDKAYNTVLIEKELTLDTDPPKIEIISPSKGSFIYENYANEVDIRGKTEPNTKVFLYIERSPLGFLNKTFDVNGLPSSLEHIEDTHLRPDCKLEVGGSHFCQTGSDYSTTADKNGDFVIDDVDLTSWFGIGARITEVPASELSESRRYDREYREARSARLIFVASDTSRLRNAIQVRYNVGTCWSGNFSWEVTPLVQYQSPSVLSMERLRENNEQIYFYFNYTYFGRGINPEITHVSIKEACGSTDLQRDNRFNLSCKILPPAAQTATINPEGSLSYSSINLGRLENMDQWLENDWKGFFKALNNELTFPVKLIITYKHDIDGRTLTETQTTCQEITYTLDNSLIDFREVLPDFILYDFVDFLNSSIDGIHAAQEQLRKVIDYVSVGCISSYLLRLSMQISRRWITFFDEKTFILGQYTDLSEVFNIEKDEDRSYCQDVVNGVVKSLNLGSAKNFKLKHLSDSDLKRCFPRSADAWDREANFYKYYRFTCDRIFGHSSPSRWTETVDDNALTNKLNSGSGCATDQSVFGQKLYSSKCRDIAKTYTLDKDIFNEDDKCFNVQESNTEKSLYTLGELINSEYKVYEISVKEGDNRVASKYAIKQTENNFLTAKNQLCAEACNIKESSDKEKIDQTILDSRWDGVDNTKLDNEEVVNGKWACLPVHECRSLVQKGKESGKPYVKNSFTKGYTRDCFYMSNVANTPTALKSIESISDDPNLRYECCCIDAIKAAPSKYYRFDDEVKYKVEGSQLAEKAFQSKKSLASDDITEIDSPTSWEDMQWSYRYWKENYETIDVQTRKQHNEYNPYRYIEDRDQAACFGSNHLIYDASNAGLFGNKATEGNLLVMDPTKQFVSSVQCLHLSGVYNRLQMIKNLMSSLQSCLITVRTTGTGDTGVCKELFSQYLCGLLWQVIQFFQDGCLPFGHGVDISKSDNEIVQYFSAGIKSVWGSIEDSRSELMDEYGNARLQNLLGTGEEAVARKICLAAFGYDWEFNVNNIVDIAYASPVSTLVHKMTGTREYLTIEPETQRASYEYRASWLINPGCDLRNYKIELSCISNNEAQKYALVTNDFSSGGINCEKVKDPSGRNCDCWEHSRERLHEFYDHNTKLNQGSLEDNRWVRIINDEYRYDHLKFTLRTDPKLDREITSRCFPDMHEDGVFYFPLRDKSIQDVGLCYVDINSGKFLCTPDLDFWSTQGKAHFKEILVNGVTYDRDKENLLFKGDKFVVEPVIRKLQGPPVCLVTTVRRSGGPHDTYTNVIDIDDEHNYPIPVTDYVRVVEKGSASGHLIDCLPHTIDSSKDDEIYCKRQLEDDIIRLKTIGNTNDEEVILIFEFRDMWSRTGGKNGKIDLSRDSEDMMIVEGTSKLVKDWWNEEQDKVIVNLDYMGISLELDYVGYGQKVDYVQYKAIITPPTSSQQTWTVNLGLYQPRDNQSDCTTYQGKIVEYEGRDQKETLTFTVKDEESEDPFIPKIEIKVDSEPIVTYDESIIINIVVKDDKGIDTVTYKVEQPDGPTLSDNERRGRVRMSCDEEVESTNYVKKECELRLDIEDIPTGGFYKVTVEAKDKDPEGKQKVHSEKAQKSFNVMCYGTTPGRNRELGICQKVDNCGIAEIQNLEMDCPIDYKCCAERIYEE